MTTRTHFWNWIANRYAASPVANQEAYEHKLSVTQQYLKPHMHVLEVGCGTGTTALIQSSFVDRVTATDYSEKMIDIARIKARKESVDNVEFYCESVEELSEHKEQYDVLMAHSVLHLMEDLDDTLARMYEQIKPGGYLVSSTPCINDVMWFFRFIAPIGYALYLLPFVRCFSGDFIVERIRDAGFRVDYHWRPDAKGSVFMVAQKPLTMLGSRQA